MKKVFYLYQHIPKCGGVSFIRTCRQWFPALREKVGSYPDAERIAEFARTRKDFDELEPDTFLHGHLVNKGIRPFERYGDHIDGGRCRVITIIRDPLERWISAYYHRQRIGKPWPEPLKNWLQRGKNPLADYFDVDERTWKARMDRYFHVGTTESIQLTTDTFARKVDRPPVPTPHLNASPRDGCELNETARKEFRERHSLDYKIYRYAAERLKNDALRLGLAIRVFAFFLVQLLVDSADDLDLIF